MSHPYQPLDYHQALQTLEDCRDHLPAEEVARFQRAAVRLVRQRRGPTLGLWDLTHASRGVLSAIYAAANARWVACLTADELYVATGCGRNELPGVLRELESHGYLRVLTAAREGKTVRLFQVVPLDGERPAPRPEDWSPAQDRRSYRARSGAERAKDLARLKESGPGDRARQETREVPVLAPAAQSVEAALERLARLNECLAVPGARAIEEAQAARAEDGRQPLTARETLKGIVEPLEELEADCQAGRLSWPAAKLGIEEADARKIARASGNFGSYARTVARNAHRISTSRRGVSHDPDAMGRAAEKAANRLLERARELNKAGELTAAREVLAELVAMSDALAPVIGSPELAEAHVRSAFKKGQRDVVSAPRAVSLSDYYPEWDWPEELEAA